MRTFDIAPDGTENRVRPARGRTRTLFSFKCRPLAPANRSSGAFSPD
jgi:hypothetical protein